jgi:prepilin-type processing-associated H-X9-DG protein
LLVVISIVALLAAMLMPAINAARESARQRACANNLRQFGFLLLARSSLDGLRGGRFCTGAFDWKRDGCVTEVGWVADLVSQGGLVGEMLCPSNPCRVSETYNDLLTLDPVQSDCVDRLGKAPATAVDGSVANPCRFIAEQSLAAGSEGRRKLVEEQIFDKFYNTNYTASWFLVRSGLELGGNGRPLAARQECGLSLRSRNTTIGPLTLRFLDASGTPSSLVPLLGCGGPSGTLAAAIGPNDAGSLAAQSFTNGPVLKATSQPPVLAANPSGIPVGPPPKWAADTLQDYRGFAPVHRGQCNVLFADGSVRSFRDENKDNLLNNGFDAALGSGFADAQIELPETAVMSLYSLTVRPSGAPASRYLDIR